MKRLNSKCFSLRKKFNFEAFFPYILLIPFILGFLSFFVQPLILSGMYSFNKVTLSAGGAVYNPVGFDYYYNALFVNAQFREKLFFSIQDLVVNVPLIIIFSLFIATVLNSEFYGRNFARIVLFLPVIVTAGVLLSLESSDYLIQQGFSAVKNGGGSEGGSVYSSVNSMDLETLLTSLRLPPQVMDYLNTVVQRFYEILTSSGVQITLLLAALQSISPSLYEASSIEGATPWENFWKITIPIISPYIFVCGLYSIIDSFAKPTNQVMDFIKNVAFGSEMNYGLSSAMSWIYFILISIALGLLMLLFMKSKFVFYQDN